MIRLRTNPWTSSVQTKWTSRGSRLFMKSIVGRFVLLVMLTLTITGRAEKLGETFISSGEGFQAEGTLRRVAYAPPATDYVVFEGLWRAVLGKNGIYVSVTYNRKKSEVAAIGADQFELLTTEGGQQRGTIRAADQFFVGSEGQIVSQFIVKRISEMGKGLTPSNGPASWYHLVTALPADLVNGVRRSQEIDQSRLTESWFVSRYAATGPVPEYGTNGFLAIKYQGNTDSIVPDETIEVQEYWPKEHPVEAHDVDLFRDTIIKVLSVTEVTNVNLLPVVTYKDMGLEDFRFGGNTNPVGFTASQVAWVSKNSASWRKLQTIAKAKLNDPQFLALARQGIDRRKNTIRYIILGVMVSVSVFVSSTVLHRVFRKTPKQTKHYENI